jgi:transposase
VLVAEWGTDMRRIGTAGRISAWIGVARGNDESAGKQRSGKTRKGNRALQASLTQVAHAAARTKGTYLCRPCTSALAASPWEETDHDGGRPCRRHQHLS